MNSDFERELQTTRASVESARSQLLTLIGGLSRDDLTRGRRGHWTVAQVLEHVLQSDTYYVSMISDLRERQREEAPPIDVSSPSAVLGELRASLDRIIAAVDGVDEDTFYRLGGPGHQQYSILSILENVAMHDQEHAAQIAQVFETAPGK